MKKLYILVMIALTLTSLIAQPKWKKSEEEQIQDLTLFHSTQTANFPTTESLSKGNFMYEISHRFVPSIKDGFDALYGLDGPVRIRFAIGYGLQII